MSILKIFYGIKNNKKLYTWSQEKEKSEWDIHLFIHSNKMLWFYYIK
jgi:hypothetical protein